MLETQALPAEAKVPSLEALRAVSDSWRHRILTLLIREPLTPSEIAERLKIARTRVYYHLDILREHGFIRIVGERPVAAIIERTYRATARRFKLDRRMLAASSSVSQLNDAQAQLLERAADDLRISPESDVLVTRSFVRLTEAKAVELRTQILALVDEYTSASAGQCDNTFEMTFALFAIEGESQ